MTSPWLLAFNGIPGCGKTALARAVAQEIGAEVFLEPDEEEWPPAARGPDRAESLLAFRGMRVPLLVEAAEAAKQGWAVVDSYFDKLVHLHADGPGSRWLLEESHPGYGDWREAIREDWESLPNAGMLVNVAIARADWLDLLKERGRKDDAAFAAMDLEPFQEELLAAGRAFAGTSGAILVELTRGGAGLASEAQRIAGACRRVVARGYRTP